MAKNEISRPSTAGIPPFGLRMQPELKERLEAEARAEGRSMNAELIRRLEDSLRNGWVLLPQGLSDRFKEEADRNGWSFSSEVVYRLGQSLDEVNVETDGARAAHRIAELTEAVAMQRLAFQHVAVLNYAYVRALLELAEMVGFEPDDSATGQVVNMALHLKRGANLAFVKSLAVAFDYKSEKLVHVDLLDALTLYEHDDPGGAEPLFDVPAVARNQVPTREEIEAALAVLLPRRRRGESPSGEPGAQAPSANERVQEASPRVHDNLASEAPAAPKSSNDVIAEVRPGGNLNLKGEPETIKAKLLAGGITKFIPIRGGIQVAVPQSKAAAALFDVPYPNTDSPPGASKKRS